MSEIYFTSDTHFFHDQDFCYKPRGYNNMEEMNEGLVQKWNSIVKPNDEVYHLGDVILGHYDPTIINKLNGTIHIIIGNHDTDKKIQAILNAAINSKVYYCGTSMKLKYNKITLFLCHYPVLTANFDDKHFNQHVISLHGHTHQQKNWYDVSNPFIYHVGVDSHNGYPVHIDEIISDIRNHWNELGQCLRFNYTEKYI